MPNYCNNYMTISHPDPEMIKKAADAWNGGSFLQTLIPCPYELSLVAGAAIDFRKVNTDWYNKYKDFIHDLNRQTYGHEDWYSWCVANWGTKWDIGLDSAEDNRAVIEGDRFGVRFTSAWSPPTDAYDKLQDMGFKIEASYYEPGMCFIGEYSDGVDETYQIESIEQAQQEIPKHLLEEYGVIDFMQEMEAEE